MLDLFITDAMAAGAAAAPQGNVLLDLIPIILIIAVFYLLLIRPQQKKLQEHNRLVMSLDKGTKVITSGGIVGTITKVDDENNLFHVEIADKVTIHVKRDTIAEVVDKK